METIADYNNSNPSPLHSMSNHHRARAVWLSTKMWHQTIIIIQTNKPSPYISPYNFSDIDSIDSPHNNDISDNFESSYSSFCRENDYFGNNLTQKSAAQFIKTGMRINNQIERYDTECNNGITAIKFHPFRNILYCADANGRVWVWKYEGNIGANNPNNKRIINLINIKDTHLVNAPLLNGSIHSSNISGSHSYNHSHSHTQSHMGTPNPWVLSLMFCTNNYEEKGTEFETQKALANDSHSSNACVVTSFEIINAYHDTMLLCAGTTAPFALIYRNSHLGNSMSAVTAFLGNARIKPTRQQQQIHHGQRDTHNSYGNGGECHCFCD